MVVVSKLCAPQCARGQLTCRCTLSGTCVGHMISYVLPAYPVDALARHSGDSQAHWRKTQRGSGVHCMQRADNRLACNGATLSPPARIDSGGKRREGRGRIAFNGLTPVRPCNGATLSPPARIDCWGCALRHGVVTVRPRGGEVLFPCHSIVPCYSTDAARSLSTTVVRHAAERSAAANMPTDVRVGKTSNPDTVH